MWKAVLFDMDGILYDSEPHYIHNAFMCLKQLGFQGQQQEVTCIVGTSMKETFERLATLLDNRYSAKEVLETYMAYETANPLHYKEAMFPNISQVITTLKEMNLLLGCCSSSPRQTVRDSLKEMGIFDKFDVVLSDEEVTNHKPHPEVYVKAMTCLQVDPEECLIYEDSPMGIEAGKRSGAYVIARKDTRYHLNQSQADELVKDEEMLLNRIREEEKKCRKSSR